MKHGKRPTMKQKLLLKSLKLDPNNWLVSKDTSTEIVFVHRMFNNTKTVRKGEKHDNSSL